ncbi:hypothetical protein GCM10018790_15280 [Kitasatospora xanthocidica]|nr:hypothetical protein GCM10018790_15280 [Kitasatospora xanthocidica]
MVGSRSFGVAPSSIALSTSNLGDALAGVVGVVAGVAAGVVAGVAAGVAAGVVAGVPVLGVVITIPVCEEGEGAADSAARTWSTWPIEANGAFRIARNYTARSRQRHTLPNLARISARLSGPNVASTPGS